MPPLTPTIMQSSSLLSFLSCAGWSKLSGSFLLRPRLSELTVTELSECGTDDANDHETTEDNDGNCDAAVASESWQLFSLLLAAEAAGEKPRDMIDSTRLSGDLCGVDPRDDELPSVCLDAGEWLGVDLQDVEDSAAEEWCDPGKYNAGELCKVNPHEAVLSSRCNKSRSAEPDCGGTITDSGGSGSLLQLAGCVMLPKGWKPAVDGLADVTPRVGEVVTPRASGDGTFTEGGIGVLARLLSVDPLLPPSSLIRFRRRTSGALETSWRRKPARCALWNALSVAVTWLWTVLTEPRVRLKTSGVANGVVDKTSKFVPLIHSFLSRSCMVSRSLGSTVNRPFNTTPDKYTRYLLKYNIKHANWSDKNKFGHFALFGGSVSTYTIHLSLVEST